MRKLILFLITCMAMISFLANPAPESIELLDLGLIGIPIFIGLLCIGSTRTYRLYPSQYPLCLALGLYLSYLLLSALIGLMQGAPILNILRSIGPYLDFFPLILLGLMPRQILTPLTLGLILLSVGLVQISYLSYLYFSHASQINNTMGVLINRITFLDPRTTLPFLIAAPILPVILFSSTKKRILLNITAISLIFLGLFAGMITLTRAIFLSIIVTWIVFIALYFYYQLRLKLFSFSAFAKKISFYLIGLIIAILLISLIPKVHLIELGLFSRFSNQGAAHADYSNGRLYDEWLPAFSAWAQSGMVGWFFGIGAGNTFALPTGEERTYIHNLSIYSLVYGGFYGLFACVTLYLTLFKTLVNRALQRQDIGYLVFAALLIGMFFYGQLFAVHKVLAFNMMLFLMSALALMENTKDVRD